MFDLARLRVLQAVAGRGSVSGAAESLHLTPSAVSQQMGKLERAVGGRLVEPAGRGIRLTPLGEQLAARADDILALVERTEAEVQEGSDRVVGTLVVGGFATAVRALVAPALRALGDGFPDLVVKAHEMEPTEAVPQLERGQVDLAIVDTWADLPMSIPERLAHEPLLDDVADLVMPADHPLAGHDVVSLDQVPRDQAWVTWPAGSHCHRWLAHHLGSAGLQAPHLHTAMEHATQVALVGAGLGTAIVPRLGRGPLPPSVRCAELDPAPVRTVHALWRDDASRRPALRVARDELRRQAGALPD